MAEGTNIDNANSTQTSADTVLSGAIAVNIGSVDSGQLSVLFDFIREETSTSEAMITDNWVESNYSLQDHIAIKPRVYRLRGCVGEVVNRQPNKYAQYALQQLQKAKIVANVISTAQKFTGFTSWVIPFVPVVSVATQVAMASIGSINQTIDFFKQQFPQNTNVANEYMGRRQAYVYAALRYALENRIEVTLDGLQFDDTERLKFKKGVQYQRRYFLQSVSARQGDSKYISDIEVTVKEFRIAQTNFTTPKDTQAAPAAIQKPKQTTPRKTNTKKVPPAQQIVDAVEGEGNWLQKFCRVLSTSIKIDQSQGNISGKLERL